MPDGNSRGSILAGDTARAMIAIAFGAAILLGAVAAICELDARYSKPKPREAISKEAYVRLVEECMAKHSRTDETGWCISKIRETFTTDAAEGGSAGR